MAEKTEKKADPNGKIILKCKNFLFKLILWFLKNVLHICDFFQGHPRAGPP